MKANYDATMDIKSKTTRLAVIIRDAECEVQASLICSIKTTLQPAVAEARALGRAVDLCTILTCHF